MVSIGHDEWEREVTQDLDEQGRVRVTVAGITCVFRKDPAPGEIAAFLAAHAPTPMFEARQESIAQALVARSAEIDTIVAARSPLGTRQSLVDAERVAVTKLMLADVEAEQAAARISARGSKAGKGALVPLEPWTPDELRQGKRALKEEPVLPIGREQ